MTYQERKAARRDAFLQRQGKPQPRRVFRVYATAVLAVIPERFAKTPVGAFASRKEAEEFARDVGPGTMWGSQAMKALGHMMTREESNQTPPGYSAYVHFNIVSENA